MHPGLRTGELETNNIETDIGLWSKNSCRKCEENESTEIVHRAGIMAKMELITISVIH